jgi:GntR family transcriptional regulator
MSIWNKKIDKTIPTPLYFQVEQIIREGIESGELEVGALIPTEKELMEKYDISRATIRQAILSLVNDGFLRREKSKGTYVTRPTDRIYLFESLRWFSKYLETSGIPYYGRILKKDIIPAVGEVTRALQLPLNEKVFYVKRLRYLNEDPYLVDEHFIPYKLCRGIENVYQEDKSLYSTLIDDFGIQLDHGWREFKPILPSAEEVDLLRIFPNTPILEVHSAVHDQNDLPVDFFIAKLHGKFSVDVALR